MSLCHCETPARETEATIKICDCECECDCGCCIEQLYSDIAAKPNWLKDLGEKQFAHTPLHDAAALGRTTLVVEIMNLMPALGRKLNTEGFSPLHLAVKEGKADTALALAARDKQLVSVKGKGGLTPLHYAAALAKPSDANALELLLGLLADCPDAISTLNNRKQSAVHVALENGNDEAALYLVNWLIIVAKESLLSNGDDHGNTTLHVAARYCTNKDVLKSLAKLVIVNKENDYGETPLDVAIRYNNAEAKNVLIQAGVPATATQARRGSKPSLMVRYLRRPYADEWPEMLTRAYYFVTKELTMDMRNTILVVAVLIATATYQGVLQPPGGVYSAEGAPERLARARRVLADKQQHPPGRMVMGTIKYSYFMPTNTLAFISSTLIIIFVLPDRAFIMILQACLIFMCVSYLLALNFISYYNSFSKILDIVCGCTLGVAFLLKLGYYFVMAYYNDDEWLLRRLGVIINNRRAWVKGKSRKDESEKMSIMGRMRQQYLLISKRPA